MAKPIQDRKLGELMSSTTICELKYPGNQSETVSSIKNILTQFTKY